MSDMTRLGRSLFGIATLSIVLLVAVNGTPVIAQSVDAQERCRGDVMRLCSEFVPDMDLIVICLKAKRLRLTSSCLQALSPSAQEPFPTDKMRNSRRTVSPAAASRSTRTYQ
jgi:hypothetical protein